MKVVSWRAWSPILPGALLLHPRVTRLSQPRVQPPGRITALSLQVLPSVSLLEYRLQPILLPALNVALPHPAALWSVELSGESACAANVSSKQWGENRLCVLRQPQKSCRVCNACLPACRLRMWDSLYHNTVNHLRNTHLGMSRIIVLLVFNCLFQQSFLRRSSH